MNRYKGQTRDSRSPARERDPSPDIELFFDPEARQVDLFDKLAEQQADGLPTINSNQLRKYFGDIKDVFRQFVARTTNSSELEKKQIYQESFEARFKMIRSKVAYGSRASGQSKIPPDFANFISQGIAAVRSGRPDDFQNFVMHLEAVVGFMYGKGKVK